jgi:regulator of sigma E protease
MSLILGVVLVLGVMILVHEWGHFVVARLCGVRVDVFSIGFGPRLFGWKRGATDYRVSAVPLGGYVRMAGQDLSDVDRGKTAAPSGNPEELLSKTRWQRAIIAFAGPAVNLILPVVLLAGLFTLKGVPYPANLDRPMQVVAADPAIGNGGPLQPGDRIVEINGVTSPTWEKGLTLLDQATPGSLLHIVVDHDGARRIVDIPVQDPIQAARAFGPAPIAPIIAEVKVGTPADHAGLQVDDEVLTVDGKPVGTPSDFASAVNASGGKQLLVTVLRNGREVRMVAVPRQGKNEQGQSVWQVGVSIGGARIAYRHVGTAEAGRQAVAETLSFVGQVIDVVGKLFTGRVSVNQLQGVVGIARES